jgi:cell growth-regulating nucleolar protein
MVSFVCDVCQETLKKAKLDQHFNRCPQAQYSCIDCSKTFYDTSYRQHSSCVTETEKYQKNYLKKNVAMPVVNKSITEEIQNTMPKQDSVQQEASASKSLSTKENKAIDKLFKIAKKKPNLLKLLKKLKKFDENDLKKIVLSVQNDCLILGK